MLMKDNYLIIKLSAYKTQIIIIKILPSNASPVCIQYFKPSMPNCISASHALLGVCTIVLQLLCNLSINPNVCYLIIAYTISCIHTAGTTTPWQVKYLLICIIES